MEKKKEKFSIDLEIDFTYENAAEPALEDVAGKVGKGRCIVLCGSSGCGKSTLMRCMNHLIPDFYEGVLRGFCCLNGEDIADMSIGDVGRRAVSVFQDPRSQFFTLDTSSEIAFGLENFGVSNEAMRYIVERAFSEFGMEKLKNRNVFELSSGERQMTSILAAWAVNADIFLMDEPAANLDHAAAGQLHDILRKLKDSGRTLVISEHRLYYLNDIADEYWVMEDGKIAEKIPAEKMRAMDMSELRSRGLRTTSVAAVESAGAVPVQTEKHDVFRACDVSCRYRKMKDDIISRVGIEARTGDIIAITGSNGCGKTTFGKAAAGLLRDYTGSFSFNDVEMDSRELARHAIFIMQEAEFQFFTDSVIHELLYGVDRTSSNRNKIRSLLKETGMWELRKRHPFSLSGGQMQKLALMTACVSPKPVVILDEPTAGLDRRSLEVCMELIREMSREKIVFVITHDLELISGVCTQCVIFDKGTAAEHMDLGEKGNFSKLVEYMKKNFRPGDNARISEKKQRKRFLDPRGKMLLLLVAMAVAVWTDKVLILMIFGVIEAAAVYEGRYRTALCGAASMALVTAPFILFPCVAFSFIAGFFPRMILIGAAAVLALAREEAARTLAGMRRLHIPERVIMVASVIFRFFPILIRDLGIMSQSLRTRGVYSGLSEKIRAFPSYMEIMTVPMVFRVMRIAEALAASAETRGIALEGRRDSYVSIGFTAADVCLLILTAAAAAAGIIL